MAIHIITHGKGVVRCGPLRFWAERGLIHCEDSRDNSYEVIKVRDMLLRLNAHNEMRPGIDGTEDPITKKWVYEFRSHIQTMIEQMLELCRKAQEQGMPDDPTARNSLKARRPSTVVVPARPKVLKDMKGGRIGIFDDFES